MLKDTKISNSVDTESQLAEMFEVYPDLFAGDRVPRGADWLVPGQQGAAPTSTVAPPVEVEQVSAVGVWVSWTAMWLHASCNVYAHRVNCCTLCRHSLTCFLG